MTKAPALFIGHGSPMNAIEDSAAARGWAQAARRFERPRAIIAVSAHWVTDGVRVMSNPNPRTIHDFGRGFPQALFDVQYPAPGDPVLAADIVRRLASFGARLDDSWGLDHGTWSVLLHMCPEADVPIVQVSLDMRRSPQEHYAIGQALAPLRDENILIMGSGNIVHNLANFFKYRGQPMPWDLNFGQYITGAIAAGDDTAVQRYQSHPDAAQAAPDWEHFVPLLYVLGAKTAAEKAELFNAENFPGIAMASIGFGLSPHMKAPA
ncbi:MAG: 4,5-DOPA dioxygenase extradiol [Hyphomonadaceae bacterium]|nr:4,5-DOPA dioxygenase extradiol [Hyphomonadaceae bacterium]